MNIANGSNGAGKGNRRIDGKSGARRLALLPACCALALSQMAVAQQAAEQEQDAKASTLDTIVVTASSAQTATKTDTKLVETPQSISVITSEQFAERTVQNFQDIFRYSAGVNTEVQGLDVRGDFFASRGFETVQYLDGLNRMPDFIYGARLDPFTLERAEILRGPSSVLYGAGGAGGVFNAVSKRPQQDFGGEFDLVAGDHDLKEFRFDVTGAISDSVSARLVGLYRDGELQWGHKQNNDRVLINPSLSWTGDNTTVTLIGLIQHDRMGVMSYALLPEQMKALGLDYTTFFGDEGFNRMNTDYKSVSLLVDHAFNDNVSFSSHTRWYQQDVDYHETYIDVSDYFEPPFYNLYLFGVDYIDTNLLQREWYALRGHYEGLNSDNNVAFKFDTGPLSHKVLAGVDYTKFELRTREGYSCDWFEGYCWGEAGSLPGSGSPPPFNISDPNYDTGFSWGYLPWPETNIRTDSTTVGLYLQDQIKIGERVNALVGARRDKVKSEQAGTTVLDQTATTWRAGLIGEVGAGFSPYLSYSESFLPVVDVDVYGNPYKPREAKQKEVGLKWQPNRATLVTLAAFKIDENNRTVQDPANIQNFIQIGKVESKGYELEAATQLAGVDVNAAYSHIDAKIKEATDGTTGYGVSHLPKDTASLWLARSFWLGQEWKLRLGVGGRYIGERTSAQPIHDLDFGLDGVYLYTLPSTTLVDAMAELEYRNWSFSITGSNVTGKDYMAQCTLYAPNYNSGGCYVGTPRTVTATLRYRF
ncbi:MAG: TonB-dependent siderophore receptor [Pseudoxanthomonas sp.]